MQTYLCASGQVKNIDGILFDISISSVNAVNEVLDLKFTDLSINYDGEQGEHYGFINSTISISTVGDGKLFSLLSSASDLTYCIQISSNIFNWFGWIIADGLQKNGLGDIAITSFTAKDPFTALKSVRLNITDVLFTQGENMLFKFTDYIIKSLNLVYPDGITPTYNVYSDLCAGTFTDYTDSLSINKGMTGIGSIIDDDNSVMYCYDVIEKIFESYPYRIFFFNNELQIQDVNYISYCKLNNQDVIKVQCTDSVFSQSTVSLNENIGTLDESGDKFLIGTIDDIELDVEKAYKEVDVKYSSDKLASILYNSNFLQGLDYWIINDNSAGNANVSLVGDGTVINPYGMRIQSDVINFYGNGGDPDGYTMKVARSGSTVAQVIPILLGTGSTADVEIKFKTKNVTRYQANDVEQYDFTPDIYFEVVLLSKSNISSMSELSDNTLYSYDIQTSDSSPQWSGLDKDKYLPAINTNGTIYRYFNGSIVSSNFTTGETPKDGYLAVVFYPFYFDSQTNQDTATYSQRPYWDILEVNITLNNKNGLAALDNIKEETYKLQQNGYFSEIKDVDITLSEKYNKNLTFGYKYLENGSVQNLRKSTYRNVNNYLGKVDLGLLYAASYMSLRRKPCIRASFSVRGLINMLNLHSIKTISDYLFINSCTYDLINAECSVEGFDSSIQNKVVSVDTLNDTYDYYTLTNDYTDSYSYEYRNKSFDFFQKEAKKVTDLYNG